MYIWIEDWAVQLPPARNLVRRHCGGRRLGAHCRTLHRSDERDSASGLACVLCLQFSCCRPAQGRSLHAIVSTVRPTNPRCGRTPLDGSTTAPPIARVVPESRSWPNAFRDERRLAQPYLARRCMRPSSPSSCWGVRLQSCQVRFSVGGVRAPVTLSRNAEVEVLANVLADDVGVFRQLPTVMSPYGSAKPSSAVA